VRKLSETLNSLTKLSRKLPRLAKKNRILRIRSGFFIIGPLEYQTTWVFTCGMVYR